METSSTTAVSAVAAAAAAAPGVIDAALFPLTGLLLLVGRASCGRAGVNVVDGRDRGHDGAGLVAMAGRGWEKVAISGANVLLKSI